MRDFILKTLVALRHDERGVTLVEYGIALSIALGIGAIVYTTLAGDISGAMTAAGSAMPD